MNKKSFVNSNFNFFFFIPYLIWLFFIFFFIFNSELIKAGALDGLVKYGNDSSYYIDSANKLVDWDFSNIDFSKLSYVLLIAIVLFLNLNLATVVILQFISTIIASYCLYLIGKKFTLDGLVYYV